MHQFVAVIVPYGEHILFPAEFADVLPHIKFASKGFSSDPYIVDSEQPVEAYMLPASRVQYKPQASPEPVVPKGGEPTSADKPDDLPF